jgi:hypothetical protein
VSPIQAALDALCAEVAEHTARIGRRVEPAGLGVLDRTGHLALGSPGLASPNGACRLIRAADGWLAVNLARKEDRDLVPAWLGCDFGGEPWTLIGTHSGGQTRAALINAATLLGLPAAAVGETKADSPHAPLLRMAAGTARTAPLSVVDLTALWAGPMCGAILAAMGASVTKVESVRRPDPTRASTPAFFSNLNGAKAHLTLDLADPGAQAALRDRIADADVLITSARPRAFAGLGLDPTAVFAANPGLVWTAITGHGWSGEAAARVGFGDDTAAAGGLVRWTSDGPRFLGDALADPVTGLAAAVGTLRALEQGGGLLVDVALARSAAGAAALCRLPRAA